MDDLPDGRRWQLNNTERVVLDLPVSQMQWGYDQAPELMNHALDAQERLMAETIEPSPSPASFYSARQEAHDRSMKAVEGVITAIQPYLPHVADGADEFLRKLNGL